MTQEVNKKSQSLGEQMYEFLERKPENYDVAFSVGTEKKIVKAIKFIMKASSSVFEQEFVDSWDSLVIEEGKGIPLPELDPTAFQLFVKLLIQDKWSADDINSLNLSADVSFSLLVICRRFGITKAMPVVEEAANGFIRAFTQYKDTDDFLKLSQTNLETILSCKEVVTDEKNLFDAVCRWGRYQCDQRGIEKSDANIREVLGNCLFEIRFPIMSTTDFTLATKFNNILTPEEKLAIYQYIGLQGEEKASYDLTQLPFRAQPRVPLLTLCLKNIFTSVENPAFVCDGSTLLSYLQASRKIELHGIGFLAPSQDSEYDVTLQVKRRTNCTWTYSSRKVEKKISARKGQVVYLFLDQPVAMDPILESSWSNYYQLEFSLKGPELPQFNNNAGVKNVVAAGITFRLNSWDSGRPIAEIIFKLV